MDRLAFGALFVNAENYQERAARHDRVNRDDAIDTRPAVHFLLLAPR